MLDFKSKGLKKLVINRYDFGLILLLNSYWGKKHKYINSYSICKRYKNQTLFYFQNWQHLK